MSSEAFAIGVVSALALAALVAMARRSRRSRERLSRQWPRVDGEVLEVWQDGMGSYCVRYRYTPQGSASPMTREEVAGCLRAALPEVGDRVSVRYDPNAPRRATMQPGGC